LKLNMNSRSCILSSQSQVLAWNDSPHDARFFPALWSRRWHPRETREGKWQILVLMTTPIAYRVTQTNVGVSYVYFLSPEVIGGARVRPGGGGGGTFLRAPSSVGPAIGAARVRPGGGGGGKFRAGGSEFRGG
jgi:hypothetical protein